MSKYDSFGVEQLSEPVQLSNEAYVSEAYARAEADKLWPKVWQMACRVEEIRHQPAPGVIGGHRVERRHRRRGTAVLVDEGCRRLGGRPRILQFEQPPAETPAVGLLNEALEIDADVDAARCRR